MKQLPHEYIDVTSAEVLDEQQVRLTFSNGDVGDVDLMDVVHGPEFDKIINSGDLMDFVVDDSLGTLVWKNGGDMYAVMDIAPEVLWMKAAHLPRDF